MKHNPNITNQTYIVISIASILAGIIFFAFYTQRIVIRSTIDTLPTQHIESKATKKKVMLTFWRNNQWHTETQEIIWAESNAQNLTYLITSWLNLLDEEQITDKKITLQTALLSPSGYDAYLSFDYNPLPQEGATIEKLRWIESLLKTIRSNDIQLQTVHFLARHQPIKDPHLDFSNPWPINGFLE